MRISDLGRVATREFQRSQDFIQRGAESYLVGRIPEGQPSMLVAKTSGAEGRGWDTKSEDVSHRTSATGRWRWDSGCRIDVCWSILRTLGCAILDSLGCPIDAKRLTRLREKMFSPHQRRPQPVEEKHKVEEIE
jgi:hypothetical protein